jgi:hypothetical protein
MQNHFKRNGWVIVPIFAPQQAVADLIKFETLQCVLPPDLLTATIQRAIDFATFAGWRQVDLPENHESDDPNVRTFVPSVSGDVHVYNSNSIKFPVKGIEFFSTRQW